MLQAGTEEEYTVGTCVLQAGTEEEYTVCSRLEQRKNTQCAPGWNRGGIHTVLQAGTEEEYTVCSRLEQRTNTHCAPGWNRGGIHSVLQAGTEEEYTLCSRLEQRRHSVNSEELSHIKPTSRWQNKKGPSASAPEDIKTQEKGQGAHHNSMCIRVRSVGISSAKYGTLFERESLQFCFN